MREDFIHYVVRQYLRSLEWILIAGQYPDGSDDELPPLNVSDPNLARDNSPDHRRHSKNKLVPDLVAVKHSTVLVIEMKPKFSKRDEEKLIRMLGPRRTDFLRSLQELARSKAIELRLDGRLTIVPALGLPEHAKFPRRPDFCYIRVRSLAEVLFEGNNLLSGL